MSIKLLQSLHPSFTLEDYKLSDKDCSFLVHKSKRVSETCRPHRPFRSWKMGRKIPWVFLLEVSIFVDYVIFGVIHQSTTSNTTLEFKAAVYQYFFLGYGFDDSDDEDAKVALGNIYTKDTLYQIVQSTGERLLSFEKEFPCVMSFHAEDVYTATAIFVTGDTVSCTFSKDNSSLLTRFVQVAISDLAQLTLNMNYDIENDNEGEQKRVQLRVFATFTLDPYSDIIFFSVYHERTDGDSYSDGNLISLNLELIFPVFIAILSAICIIVILCNTYSLYLYSKDKAAYNSEPILDLFMHRFDKWTFYSLLCHILTIIGCIAYSIEGREYTDEIPYPEIILSFSSLLYCFLMIRYLRYRVSIMVVVNAIAHEVSEMGQFLIGCFLIFFGYQIFGICAFGVYHDEFVSYIGSATVMESVIQGDTIHDRFMELNNRPPCSFYLIFAYLSSWAYFGSIFLCNISISIFERSLTKEIYKAAAASKATKNVINEQVEIGGNFIPISLKNVF